MPKRTVKESPIERGIKETYPYKFTLTGNFPSGTYASPANNLYEKNANGAYLTAVAGWSSGSPAIATGVFTTSSFVASQLTAGETYRLECSFTIDGETWDWNLFINARN